METNGDGRVLHVLGRIYRVHIGRRDEELRPSWGNVNHASREIDIRGDLALANQREALLHELFHCLDNILHGNESLPESTTHTLSNGLLCVLLQNRIFVEELLSDGASGPPDAQSPKR